MANNYQSLKSASNVRVSTGKAENLYGFTRNLGESLLCSAGAQYLQSDIYGRPANQNTLTVNLDAACAQGTQFPTYRYLQVENMQRPYLPIAASGLRGAADFQGVGRDLIPQNLYGINSSRANMSRIYNNRSNQPWEWEQVMQTEPRFYQIQKIQPNDMSHDASTSVFVK